ncbi:MAG TPA: sporulation initiation factor Spo0A C-terminal domain-containing protein [Pseudobacteroides sp.]|uniref:sporulation initiation factor Spo0A C-terminal domain-containing protein n=1 Tax=Pseudobacteroides sp. TaxID=1968840 RepID=UPI002F94E14B
MIKRIREYVKDEPGLKNENISNHKAVEIDEMLSSIGIQKNSKGFVYLKDIINLYLALHNITLNNAYKNIACKYKSNWRTIEKAIRRAIISGYNNQTTVYKELYGRNIPSTLDFIDIFIDKCR